MPKKDWGAIQDDDASIGDHGESAGSAPDESDDDPEDSVGEEGTEDEKPQARGKLDDYISTRHRSHRFKNVRIESLGRFLKKIAVPKGKMPSVLGDEISLVAGEVTFKSGMAVLKISTRQLYASRDEKGGSVFPTKIVARLWVAPDVPAPIHVDMSQVLPTLTARRGTTAGLGLAYNIAGVPGADTREELVDSDAASFDRTAVEIVHSRDLFMKEFAEHVPCIRQKATGVPYGLHSTARLIAAIENQVTGEPTQLPTWGDLIHKDGKWYVPIAPDVLERFKRQLLNPVTRDAEYGVYVIRDDRECVIRLTTDPRITLATVLLTFRAEWVTTTEKPEKGKGPG